ncbi:hypothetical protein [Novispirillum itersonii]|uniref:Uncharacterized protein n=1 Tax=Novispirillum itersonii TaxID=189 RepID=A0A7X0DPL4_NOVIT|nr:hypothetical protein [Novispirillum itersonii]MBB6212494.1 hypothetical protein [Novispirillum itersonii]
MKPLSPTLKSIARHTAAISWNGLLDTISILITGAGLGVLLTLIGLQANDIPLIVQITDTSGTTVLGPTEPVSLLWRCAVAGTGIWLLWSGVFSALTGRVIFMPRLTAAIGAVFIDLIQHVPALARLARRVRMHTERKN